MSKTKPARMATLLLLAALLMGCGKKPAEETDSGKKPTEVIDSAKKPIEEIDFGTVANSVYTNHFLGMTVNIPKDWSIQDKDAQDRLKQLGEKIVTGEDKNMQAIVKASELQTVSLFAAFKFPYGSPVAFNPSVMSVAENVRQFPGIKTGKDVLFQVKQMLESGQLTMSFSKDSYTKKLGGVDFDVLESETTVRNLVVKQKYFVTLIKGYSLSIVATYMTDEDLDSVQKILDSVTFK